MKPCKNMLITIALILSAGPGIAGTGGLAADGCHKHGDETIRHYPGTKEPHGICISVDGETVKIPNAVVSEIQSLVPEKIVEVPVTKEVMIDPAPELVKERDAAIQAAEDAIRLASEARTQTLEFQVAMDNARSAQEAAEADRDAHEKKILELERGRDLCAQEQGEAIGAMGSWGTRLEEAVQKLIDCLNVGH